MVDFSENVFSHMTILGGSNNFVEPPLLLLFIFRVFPRKVFHDVLDIFNPQFVEQFRRFGIHHEQRYRVQNGVARGVCAFMRHCQKTVDRISCNYHLFARDFYFCVIDKKFQSYHPLFSVWKNLFASGASLPYSYISL